MTAIQPLPLLLFLVAALVTILGAAAWLMRGAARATAPPPDQELAVYRSQLAEIDRDIAAGRIAPEVADAARLEVGRRLARTEARMQAATGAGAAGAGKDVRAAVLVAAALMGLATVGLYLVRGTLAPDMPFQERKAELMARPPETLSDEELLSILQERARQAPEDPNPHFFMGQILDSIGREPDAIRAYQAALRRDPRYVDAMAELGGILVRQAGGQLDDQSRSVFARVLALEPEHPLTLFHLARAKWSSGDRAGAMTDWSRAWNAVPQGNPQRNVILARVLETLTELDMGPAAGDGGAPGDGPQQGPFEAMAGASPEEQAAFIQSMVARRSERQAASPDDFGLRLSLLRIVAMTGDRPRAEALVRDGAALAAGDPFLSALMDAAAASVGLPLSPSVPRTAPPEGPANTPSRDEVAK